MRLPYAKRQQLKCVPGLLALRFNLFRTETPLLVSRSTRVCIDGFPRSGNSFAVMSVAWHLELLGKHVAHHTHSIVNLDRAIAHRVPVFVPVREPIGCCLSLTVLGATTGIDDALRAYLKFHEACQRRLGRVTVVRFDDLITSARPLVHRVAHAIGTTSPVKDGDVKGSLERSAAAHGTTLAIPDAVRTRRKAELWARSQSAKTTRLLERCQHAYERVLASAPHVVAPPATADRP